MEVINELLGPDRLVALGPSMRWMKTVEPVTPLMYPES